VIHVSRYLSALLTLVLGYASYALAVAPWFEPPPVQRRIVTDEQPSAPQISDENEKELAALFPEDHWVRKSPKIFETDLCKLLIQDYQPLPDGHLELKPCVLVFYSGGRRQPTTGAAEPAARGRPIILEAPKAELVFDRPVDFKRAEFGRVQKGTLSGDVTIYSPPTAPGSRDELLVRTRAVWLDRQSIRTANDVEFQYGDSSGKGRDLNIGLRSDPPGEKKAAKSKFGAVQTMTLQHLDYLRVVTAGQGLLSDARPGASGNTATTEPAPIEVTCQGEFSFDVVGQLARFERQVQVRRLLPGAPPDQLHCEELLLAFAEKKAAATTSDSASSEDPLAGRLARMVAMGTPAVLDAPSSGVHAVAAFMEYSLADRYVTLKSDKRTPQASLRQGEQHFTAPQLHYKLAEEGRLGQLHAGGPGELRMVQNRGTERQIITARWQKELQIQRQEQYHVISLLDAASVTIDPMGRFDGNELHLWVIEVPVPATATTEGVGSHLPITPVEVDGFPRQMTPDPIAAGSATEQKPKVMLAPHRMLAIGQVHVVSQQLDVDTPRLEAWFINLPAEPVQMQPLAPPQRIREPVQRASFSPDDPPPQATIRNVIRQPNDQKFHASGSKIQLQALVRGRTFELEDLIVSGQAVVDEVRTPEPGQEPMFLRGDLLELHKGTMPDATIDVSGHPAEVGGRGMWLAGGKIQVFRGTNEMRIDGPGEATMPAAHGTQIGAQAPEVRVQEAPQKMHIVWQERLVFDGLTARFLGDVQIRTATQVALAPAVEATLSQRVDFQAIGGTAGRAPKPESVGRSTAETRVDKPSVATQPELARVFLDGGMQGVYIENRGLNEFGDQISREKMNVRNLTIDRLAGKMHGAGPGWVNTVRRGSGGLPGAPGGPPPPNPAIAANQPLTSVHVAFEKEMVGDMARRQVEFHQHVLTTYSPANDFTDFLVADPLADLPERMILLESDTLAVRELGEPPTRWFEMEATGHTTVRGTKADVNAPIITYSSAKDTLILRGDGRAKAKVWMSRLPGQAPNWIDAEELRYNLRTGELQQDNASNIHIELGPTGPLQGVPNLAAPTNTAPKKKKGSRIP
jgi:hypothetical protein